MRDSMKSQSGGLSSSISIHLCLFPDLPLDVCFLRSTYVTWTRIGDLMRGLSCDVWRQNVQSALNFSEALGVLEQVFSKSGVASLVDEGHHIGPRLTEELVDKTPRAGEPPVYARPTAVDLSSVEADSLLALDLRLSSLVL